MAVDEALSDPPSMGAVATDQGEVQRAVVGRAQTRASALPADTVSANDAGELTTSTASDPASPTAGEILSVGGGRTASFRASVADPGRASETRLQEVVQLERRLLGRAPLRLG